MHRMKEQGHAVVFITHKMNEVMEVADRITVLRKGETVATVEKEGAIPRHLIEMMVGRSVDLQIKRLEMQRGRKILEVCGVDAVNTYGSAVLKNICFNLYAGEILGVAGVAGSGQKELCEAIAGLYPVKSGKIIFEDENIVGLSPAKIMRKGISFSFVPEDRLGMGLVASMGVVDNIVLKQYSIKRDFY